MFCCHSTRLMVRALATWSCSLISVNFSLKGAFKSYDCCYCLRSGHENKTLKNPCSRHKLDLLFYKASHVELVQIWKQSLSCFSKMLIGEICTHNLLHTELMDNIFKNTTGIFISQFNQASLLI